MLYLDYNNKAMAAVCGGGKAPPEQASKFSALMEIWKGRVTHGLEENDYIKVPYETSHIAQLLHRVTEVFHDICPIVPPMYVGILKNIFLLHLRNAWSTNPEAVPSDDYWKHATLFVDGCFTHLGPRDAGNHLVNKQTCNTFIDILIQCNNKFQIFYSYKLKVVLKKEWGWILQFLSPQFLMI